MQEGVITSKPTIRKPVAHKVLLKRAIGNEVFVHALLWVLYLLATAYSRREPGLELYQLVFTFNYIIVVTLVNYVFLPRLFYRKRYKAFFGAVAAVLFASMLLEELVLEKIFFPDTRGDYFNPYYALIQISTTVGFFGGFRLAWDYHFTTRAMETLEKEKAESQLNYLKSQINPHFLFNNLNNLYAYALEKSDKVPEMILGLSDILRYVLYESQGTYVSLGRELEQLKHYVALQRTQLEGRGSVTLAIDGEAEGYRIAPLLLFSFVENSFKHSHSSQLAHVNIAITVTVADGRLLFVCTNPYEDVYRDSQHPNGEAKGIGLKNVRERLQLLYADKHELTITEDGQTYTVALDVELV